MAQAPLHRIPFANYIMNGNSLDRAGKHQWQHHEIVGEVLGSPRLPFTLTVTSANTARYERCLSASEERRGLLHIQKHLSNHP